MQSATRGLSSLLFVSGWNGARGCERTSRWNRKQRSKGEMRDVILRCCICPKTSPFLTFGTTSFLLHFLSISHHHTGRQRPARAKGVTRDNRRVWKKCRLIPTLIPAWTVKRSPSLSLRKHLATGYQRWSWWFWTKRRTWTTWTKGMHHSICEVECATISLRLLSGCSSLSSFFLLFAL